MEELAVQVVVALQLGFPFVVRHPVQVAFHAVLKHSHCVDVREDGI